MNSIVHDLVAINSVEIGGEEVHTVNARDLHQFLGSKQEFTHWMKNRIREYGFKLNQDFIIVQNLRMTNLSSAKSRPQRVNDYLLTIDMAKELSMVEKTAKGREVRRYFIDCEKVMRKINDNLIMQFNRAVLEFEKFSELASNAGRTLNIVGKQHKPQAKAKVSSLKDKIQPHLFILPDDDDKDGGSEGGAA